MTLYVTALCFFLLWMLATFFLFCDFKRKNPIPQNPGTSLKDIIPTNEQTDYVMQGLLFERKTSLFKKVLYYVQGIFFWIGLILWFIGQGYDSGLFELVASTFDKIRDLVADFSFYSSPKITLPFDPSTFCTVFLLKLCVIP